MAYSPPGSCPLCDNHCVEYGGSSCTDVSCRLPICSSCHKQFHSSQIESLIDEDWVSYIQLLNSREAWLISEGLEVDVLPQDLGFTPAMQSNLDTFTDSSVFYRKLWRWKGVSIVVWADLSLTHQRIMAGAVDEALRIALPATGSIINVALAVPYPIPIAGNNDDWASLSYLNLSSRPSRIRSSTQGQDRPNTIRTFVQYVPDTNLDSGPRPRFFGSDINQATFSLATSLDWESIVSSIAYDYIDRAETPCGLRKHIIPDPKLLNLSLWPHAGRGYMSSLEKERGWKHMPEDDWDDKISEIDDFWLLP